MKQIFANLDVKCWPFGIVKSFEKQHFDDRLYRLKPDKSEYGDNWDHVQDAFGTAIAMLHKIWNKPTCLSLVARTIRVLISFNSDYSTWKVDIDPYGIGPSIQKAHPDFNSSIEKEDNQILEKYGFADEKKPPKKFEVAYRGRKTIMDENQFDDFLKDIVKMYPRSWQVMTSIREVNHE